MDFCILTAGVAVRINHKYGFVRRLCEGYLTDREPDLSVSVTDDEIDAETELTNNVFPREVCEATCLHRAITNGLVKYGVMLIHSAAVSLDDEAYVFIAKSGVGKSTHIRLWQKVYGDRALVVNGDKPYYSFEDGVLTVHGSPWRGKELLGAPVSRPVRAICILERGEENEIRRASVSEALGRFFHQVLLPKDDPELSLFMKMADRILKEIPFYILKCNMNDDAAVVACRGMRGK